MLELPAIRWGEPYRSLETDEVVHFDNGEPIARIGRVGGGIVRRDLLHADRARQALRALACDELIALTKQAAELYQNATLPMGDGAQSPDDFVYAQSASTGLPEHMCRANMQKNVFVLTHIDEILDALTRGLDLSILSRGFGDEGRGVTVSYQAQTPVLGAVLPSNSPGVHALWLPVIPLQIGLALKPGAREPWTPYRMRAAMVAAGIPAEAISIYPGPGGDVGAALLATCRRSMIFGDLKTVQQYAGNPGVQVHGPGFSKILLGDDVVDRWEDYLDLMVESVAVNGGRSCINCSGIWASRHTEEIARALAERLGPIAPLPPSDPQAELAAFTVPSMAEAIWGAIEADLSDAAVTDVTAPSGPRLDVRERCAYLRPTIVHCDSPEPAAAQREYLFPYAAVVRCPQQEMLERIGSTLVASAITDDSSWIAELTDAVQIDRLNIGPLPTNRIDWLQPHEGNLIDLLYRSRAYQVAKA